MGSENVYRKANRRRRKPKAPGKQIDPSVKLVLRHLPANLTSTKFHEQLNSFISSKTSESIIDSYYIQGNIEVNKDESAIESRAYVLISDTKSVETLLRETFGKAFHDESTKASSIPKIEKALFDKMPIEGEKSNEHRKIEEDEYFKAFVNFENGKAENFDISKVTKQLDKKKTKNKRGKSAKSKKGSKEIAESSGGSTQTTEKKKDKTVKDKVEKESKTKTKESEDNKPEDKPKKKKQKKKTNGKASTAVESANGSEVKTAKEKRSSRRKNRDKGETNGESNASEGARISTETKKRKRKSKSKAKVSAENSNGEKSKPGNTKSNEGLDAKCSTPITVSTGNEI